MSRVVPSDVFPKRVSKDSKKANVVEGRSNGEVELQFAPQFLIKILNKEGPDKFTKNKNSVENGTIVSESRNSSSNKKNPLAVLGSGDLGTALTACLCRAGFTVYVASRNPQKSRPRVEEVGGISVNYRDAMSAADIVFMAVPAECHADLETSLFVDKIVVDVSNRPPNFKQMNSSVAEVLQKKLPQSSVIKGLNTLSAYALRNGNVQGSKQVPLCGDSQQAKTKVMNIVKKLGFAPLDSGSLEKAREIEDIPLQLFNNWKSTTIVTFLIFFTIWLVVLFRNQLCPNFSRENGTEWQWELFHSFPLKAAGNAAAITSFNLFASCYFPGVLAAYIQLYRGTKYSAFPDWLDKWMKSRKYLGLFALGNAAIHCIIGLAIKISTGLSVSLSIQASLLFGGISLFTMVIMGITSLPSVASTLTWKEFFFVQSYVGWFSFVLACLHTILAEIDNIFALNFECGFIPHQAQIALIFPTLTIILKSPLLLPCVNSHLQSIRRGQDRRNKRAYIHPA